MGVPGKPRENPGTELKRENNIDEVVELASRNPKTAVVAAQRLKLNEDQLEKLLKSALNSPRYAYGFFFSVKIPGALRNRYLKDAVEAASRDPLYALRFLKNVRTDVRLMKKLVEGISKDPKRSYRAGVFLQKSTCTHYQGASGASRERGGKGSSLRPLFCSRSVGPT